MHRIKSACQVHTEAAVCICSNAGPLHHHACAWSAAGVGLPHAANPMLLKCTVSETQFWVATHAGCCACAYVICMQVMQQTSCINQETAQHPPEWMRTKRLQGMRIMQAIHEPALSCCAGTAVICDCKLAFCTVVA